MTLLASSLGGTLHPTNVVTSWLKKCLLSLFESRSPGTFPPFNNNILISNTHIPLYSPQNTNRYRFFRRIKFVSTSGQRSLISDCGKKTPTTETVRMVRGQWLHTSGGGTHVQTYKHVPATCVRMHTVPTCQGQPGHTRRQRCVHVCEALWNVTDQTLRKPLCRHAQLPPLWPEPLPQTDTGFMILPSPRHRETPLSRHAWWLISKPLGINYHLLLLKCLLNSAWAPSGWTEQLVNRTCDSHEIRTAYCYYVTWYLVVLS